ncbi:MAG TPA: molybdopterin-dependent oxidoreductase [Ignavibacteria bacterium]|nr:molybdopterin-dependent oxidoreductase [Ignavibacteria bacterium]
MNNFDYIKHLRGESLFIDDAAVPEGTLHAFIYGAPYGHGKILSLDLREALASGGVKCILTHKDIKGENQIGGIIQDEELLASDEFHFWGEPVALVIAETIDKARDASKKIKCEFEKKEVIINEIDAYRKNSLIMPPRVFASGDIEEGFGNSDYIFEGRVESGGQEHLYLETQRAAAVPMESGKIILYSSTQNPTATQRTASRVLGIPQNLIEVDVLRLGGGFGGKEDQATPYAVLAALGAQKTGKPVQLVLDRQDDMRMTGKRHPYTSDYKIGFTREGKILAYEVTFYQNAGAAADLSPAILDRTLFHAANSYNIPNVKATGISCKTNLPPNTAFRGFGGPQGMLVIESAIQKAAQELNYHTHYLQEINMLRKGDVTHYGQKIEDDNLYECWKQLNNKILIDKRSRAIERENSADRLHKKGFAFMPICFGISFTNTFMNQASALVHVYSDGSVNISTAAIEMGQGVNEKMRLTAARVFSINPDRVRVETTNTTRTANTSPTAASSGADMNGKAVEIACKEILSRMKNFISEGGDKKVEFNNEEVFVDGKKSVYTWDTLVQSALRSRVNLSAHSQYSTPLIHFDTVTNKGMPFAYYSVGAAYVESAVDVVRGIYEIDKVEIVHDFGNSLDRKIDRGQAEGAFMQGLGWLTIEELMFSSEGKMLTSTLSAYKVPDIYYTPKEMNIEFYDCPQSRGYELESEISYKSLLGVLGSKAIGEPPFMYAIGAFFSIIKAIKHYNTELTGDVSAPLTPEKTLLLLLKKEKIKIN